MADLTIKQIIDMICKQAEEKGFGSKREDINVPEKIALIHSEVSEAYEAYRRNRIDGKHGFKEELSDALQRLMHLCALFDINVEEEILKKLEANKDRVWEKNKYNETFYDQ